ncbi:MAG TPA: hypothetical protein VN380_09975 [Thermoanaerobaculia bacterium]|nr:hypothetical protein [Thermoanaerobaculia bacterium]
MRILIAAAAAITLAACSSSAPAAPKQNAQIPPPDFEIHQVVGPAQLDYPEGNFDMKFRLDIGNRADVPITLSRVELVTVNPAGGAYSLYRRAYYLHNVIDAHQMAAVDLWVKAYSVGQSRRTNEPVTIRGTLYFESPNGNLRHVFVKELSQYGE